MDTNAYDIWNNTWSAELHTSEYAQKRIKSAKTAKLTPVSIDKEKMCGFFSGSSGEYETFLNHCPCGDFHRGQQPCKHMYRLAIELGVMNENAETNINAIPTPKSKTITFDETIDIVEQLSDEAQHVLLKIASHIRSTTPTYEMGYTSILNELTKSGLVVDTSPDKHKIKFGTKADISSFLDSEGVPYEKGMKKIELEQLCYDNLYEKSKEIFQEFVIVSIPTKYNSVKIHRYLHRKFDKDEGFDPDTGRFKMVPLLKTDLPDDDVTHQLIKRGLYKR